MFGGTDLRPEELEPGRPKVVKVGELEVALFRSGERLYAIGNRCPHRGAPLSRGRLECAEGPPAVRCPLHGWLFDLGSGRCLNQPKAETLAFDVTVRDGRIALSPRITQR